MPTKMTGSKNLRFDRYAKAVGRIQNSSGTALVREFRRRDALLSKLIEGGHLETLRLFKDGHLSIKELIDADRRDQLGEVADRLTLRRSLKTEVEEWLPTSAPERISCTRYAVSWRKFLATAQSTGLLGQDPSVMALGSVDYHRLQRAWVGSGTDWNRARAMISSFLTRLLGHRYHAFRLQVMSRYPKGKESEGVLPTATAEDFWRVIDQAPDHAKASFVAMAALGVGPKEYLGIRSEHLSPDQQTVLVNGTKTRFRQRTVAVDDRLWDWVVKAVPSQLQYKWLGKYWIRACSAAGVAKLRMYDLRHLSAQFAGDMGATDRDLMIHLGHSNPKMSHRYSRRPIARRVAAAIGDALVGERSLRVVS